MKNLEIIVVDDGSNDGSVDCIKNWISRHSNIKLYQHDGGGNRGLPASMRLGIEKATGRYVAFCESDDYWDERHAEYIVEYIKQNSDANLIFNRIKVMNLSSHKNDYERYVIQSQDFLAKNNSKNIFLFLSCNYMPTFSAACVKRDLLLKCNFDSYYPQYIDFWLWRQLCLKNPVHFVSNALTYWRRHDESYDTKENISDITDFLMASNQLLMQQVSVPWEKRFEILKLYRTHNVASSIIKEEMNYIYEEFNRNK